MRQSKISKAIGNVEKEIKDVEKTLDKIDKKVDEEVKSLKVSEAIRYVSSLIKELEDDEKNRSMSSVPKSALEQLKIFQRELIDKGESFHMRTLRGYIDIMQGQILEGVLFPLSSVKKNGKTKEEMLEAVNNAYSRADKVYRMIHALYYLTIDQEISPD